MSGLSEKSEDNPEGDIEIQIGKLRPGEKLYEELLISGDKETTEHNRIIRAKEGDIEWVKLEKSLSYLFSAIEKHDVIKCYDIIQTLISDYSSNRELVDYLHKQNALLK